MNKTLKDTRKLTFLGVMLAITIILDSTPLGAVPLGSISATITHIPTIITGVILGPIAGLIMGTSLGIISLIHAATRPMTVLDPLFVNPLISVLPRMFIGVTSYYAYKALSKVLKFTKVGDYITTFIADIVGSLTNTGLVFLMLYIVYAAEIVEKLGMAFKALLIAVFTTNAIAEAAISGLVAMTIVMAYFGLKKK